LPSCLTLSDAHSYLLFAAVVVYPIINGKFTDGKEFYCWLKIGGCGARFAPNYEAIASQKIGQVANAEIFDQVNTLQKMAQKRALIGAVLLATSASEFFTQDVGDDSF